MPKRPSFTVGDVFAMPQARGRWGACQVVRVDGPHVEVVALDHDTDAPPTLGDVTARPLLRDRHPHRVAELARLHVFGDLPWDFVALGRLPPVVPATPPSSAYAAWEALRGESAREARWRAAPEDARQRYRGGAADGLTPVTVALPSGPLTLSRHAYAVRLAFGDAPADRTWHRAGDAGGFDWRALDALPCLTHVAVCGDAPGLAAWLATRPFVTALAWEGFSAASLDLAAAPLARVDLRPAALASLRLPGGLEELTLAASAARPTAVTAEAEGALLTLRLEAWADDDLAAVTGLGAARALTVAGFSSVDLARVAKGFPALRSLALEGAPGHARGAAALAALAALERLRVASCVSLDAAAAPRLKDLAALREATVAGLRASDAAALKERWGKDRRFALKAPIDDARVFAEADFPLLRWPNNQRKGLVCSAYTSAALALLKAGDAADDARRALLRFVTGIERAVKHTGALRADERADVEASWARLAARAPAAASEGVKRGW